LGKNSGGIPKDSGARFGGDLADFQVSPSRGHNTTGPNAPRKGTVLPGNSTLYWGRRFAGYGNKPPSQ